MSEDADYFIPPLFGQAAVLREELPPLPANACDAYIRALVPEGGLVWDPFCRTETVARCAVRQGRRALLSDFNPLIAFSVRAALNPVSPRQLDRALTALAATPVVQTPLETHINNLYATACPVCGSPAVAESLVWDVESRRPLQKELHCPACNQLVCGLASDDDLAIASKVEERGRAHWSLLERLGATEGVLRLLGDRLLDLYTPRSIYSLSTIQGKLEVSVTDGAVREVLTLALLSALHHCIKQYADERGVRQRASPLVTTPAAAKAQAARPVTFVEPNCWLAFMQACSEQRARLERESGALAHPHAGSGASSHAAAKAEQERSAVTVRQASARRVAADMTEASVDLVLMAPPVIDWGDTLQLSYLWTAWLLGKDEARLFAPDYLLHPRRGNDWPFLYAAMAKNLRAVVGALAPGGKVVLCLALTGLGSLNVLLLAAAAAGLQLESVAYQPNNPESLKRPGALAAVPGYCYLRFGRASADSHIPVSADDLPGALRREALAGASGLLVERGEPSAYVWLHLAAMKRLSQAGILARLAAAHTRELPAWERLRQVHSALVQGDGRLVFIPWEAQPEAAPAGEEDSAAEDSVAALARQRGWWWLADAQAAKSQLSDRVEWAVYTVLSTTPVSSLQAVERVVYALFSGLSTPDPGLIEQCIESYATAASPLHWQLRAEDALAKRAAEHNEMVTMLVQLGHRLGSKVWIGQAELHSRQSGQALNNLLTVAERYMSLEDILPGPGDNSRAIDVIWYQNRKAIHLFEVEWTAMLGAGVFSQAGRTGGLSRYLVVPEARGSLIRSKAGRLPLLASRLREDGWAFLGFEAVRGLAQAETVSLEDVTKAAGLHEPFSPEGQQLTLL